MEDTITLHEDQINGLQVMYETEKVAKQECNSKTEHMLIDQDE